jgi:hypothetical protein
MVADYLQRLVQVELSRRIQQLEFINVLLSLLLGKLGRLECILETTQPVFSVPL